MANVTREREYQPRDRKFLGSRQRHKSRGNREVGARPAPLQGMPHPAVLHGGQPHRKETQTLAQQLRASSVIKRSDLHLGRRGSQPHDLQMWCNSGWRPMDVVVGITSLPGWCPFVRHEALGVTHPPTNGTASPANAEEGRVRRYRSRQEPTQPPPQPQPLAPSHRGSSCCCCC